ncbi:MAG TPA: glycosyltransferase family 39 protein [Acidimicrobiales bacterium]|nr:glycosyltransferase family 39 protein [Acidimicrobiales bacterium]
MTTVVSEVAADLGPAPVVTPPAVGGPMRRRPFAGALTSIVVVGLAFRVGYVLIFTQHQNNKVYDSFWYGVTANELKLGQFFALPFSGGPTAAHPPLTSILAGSVNFLVGLHAGTTFQRLVMAVLGAGVVLCVGLLGRSVAGPWVGLTAAGLAAVAPNFWIPSGIIMSETPAMLFMALILLAVVRLLRSPTMLRAALLGAACGAETLVRAELVLFVPFLLVPAALTSRTVPLRRRFELAAVGVVVCVLVVAPWVGRNLATFTDRTYVSTGEGYALLGANCPQTYSGPQLGSWSLACSSSAPTRGDESVQAARAEHVATQYAEHHTGRIPVVVLARVGRLWDVYEPIQMADVDVNEGRPAPASLAGLGFYYALVPLGIAGIVVYRRRRVRQWFLLVPAAVLTFVAVVVYGSVRFRAPFEVCLVVLAAPPLVLVGQAVGQRLAGHRAGRRGLGDERRKGAHAHAAGAPKAPIGG